MERKGEERERGVAKQKGEGEGCRGELGSGAQAAAMVGSVRRAAFLGMGEEERL